MICFVLSSKRNKCWISVEVQMLMQMCREDEQGNVLVYEDPRHRTKPGVFLLGPVFAIRENSQPPSHIFF